MRIPHLFLFFTLLFFLPNNLLAQSEKQEDSTQKKLVLVTTTDGIQRVGHIISDDGREILLQTKSLGKIYIPKANIQSIEPIKDGEVSSIDDEFEIVGPFTTRYIFTTNALPIKKKENYSMLNLYGPEVHFAVTDRLSLGVMTTWIGSPIAVAAKYSIPTKNKNINFGIGTIMGTSGYINSFNGFGGLHWGMVTFGNRRNNITLSGGLMYLGGFGENSYYQAGEYIVEAPAMFQPTLASENTLFTSPVLGIGGVMSLGSKTSLIIDAMFINGSRTRTNYWVYQEKIDATRTKYTVQNKMDSYATSFFYLMPGIRYQKSPDRAFQFSVAGVVFDGESFPLPTCSWLRKF